MIMHIITFISLLKFQKFFVAGSSVLLPTGGHSLPATITAHQLSIQAQLPLNFNHHDGDLTQYNDNTMMLDE